MNHSSPRRPLRVRALGLAVALLALGNICPLSAATLYWDTNGIATDGTYGGTGAWTGAATNWNTATDGTGALQAWNSAASPLDSASFLRGTSGTVTVTGTQTLLSVNLGSSVAPFTTGTTAYTITGGILDIRQVSFGNAISNSNGTHTIGSDIYLFGLVAATTENNRQRIANTGSALNLANIQNIAGFSGTGVQSLSLEDYGTSININGNITKGASSAGTTLLVGGAGTANTSMYALGGNNTGLTGIVTVNRGALVLNNSNALVGATSVTVANVNSGTADTAKVLIGTGGVTINKTVTFSTLGTDTTDIREIGGTNTAGTATFAGTITLNAFAASGTGSSLRVTSATGGTVAFSGNFSDNANSVALLLNGTGIVQFTRAAGMNYDGGTTVSSGTLIVANTSGSGTGTGAVSVSSGATLGGLNTGSANAGVISGATTFASGSVLAPGAGSAGTANTLTFGSTLDISGLASGTGGLLFQLGTVGDQVALSSAALTIGAGVLDLDDFSFSTLAGFDAGTYTLFDTGSSIVGSFGSNLTGTIGGMNATLSFANGGQDIVLTVTAVPEPSTCAALFGALALTGVVWIRRRA